MEEKCSDDCCSISWVIKISILLNFEDCRLLMFRLIFGISFFLNLVLLANHSSAAISFITCLAFIILWLCVATPLVFIGAYFNLKRPVTNQSLRQVTGHDQALSTHNMFITPRIPYRHCSLWCSPIQLYYPAIKFDLVQYSVSTLLIIINSIRIDHFRTHEYRSFFEFVMFT